MRINAFKPKSKICITCKTEYFQPYNSRGHIWDSRKFCSHKCKPIWNKNMKGLILSRKFFDDNPTSRGSNHWNWKGGITPTNMELRNSTQYCDWRKLIFKRDSWKCKINNENCKGRIEGHHILLWSEYPELRFDINNGITLCHYHHPRKREEEKKLTPYFKELIENKK